MLLTGCSICHNAPVNHGICNLVQVSPGLWRCGEPTTDDGWHYLAALGVNHGVKLNVPRSYDALAASNHIILSVFTISMVDQTVGKMDTERFYAALRAVDTNGCVVFCDHGQDRTGLLVGAYRVMCEHWSKVRAYAEMKANDFHVWLRGLYWTWENDVHTNPAPPVSVITNAQAAMTVTYVPTPIDGDRLRVAVHATKNQFLKLHGY